MIRQKIDFLIYRIAFKMMTYICKRMPGWAYYLELHIKDWNSKNKISHELKKSTEIFYRETCQQKEKN